MQQLVFSVSEEIKIWAQWVDLSTLSGEDVNGGERFNEQGPTGLHRDIILGSFLWQRDRLRRRENTLGTKTGSLNETRSQVTTATGLTLTHSRALRDAQVPTATSPAPFEPPRRPLQAIRLLLESFQGLLDTLQRPKNSSRTSGNSFQSS